MVDDMALVSTDSRRQGKRLHVVADQQGSTSPCVQYYLDKIPSPVVLGCKAIYGNSSPLRSTQP